jgi:type II secretory pathway pseudopilin PulG
MAAESQRRRAFALFVVIAALVVVGALATIVVVTLSGDNDQARIERVADVLHRLAAEIDTTQAASGQSFVGQVGKYPSRLSQLYTPILSTDNNCKGNKFGGGGAGSWRGPYHMVPIATTGHSIAPGFFADDVLITVSSTDLAIQMQNVSIADAQALELFVEKKSDGSGPVVTFTPSGSNPVTVQYHIVVSGC